MSALNADRGQIEAFTDAVLRYARDGGVISLRTFRDQRGGAPVKIAPHLLNGGGLSALNDAAEIEAQRAARFIEPAVFCPPIASFSGNKAREADLVEAYCLSVECDAAPKAAVEKLTALLGKVTAVVKSGGEWTDPKTGEVQDKVHLHWRLSEPATGEDLGRLKEARRLATSLVGGDPTNVPLVHPIRWPGSWHRKREPRLVVIAELNSESEIDLGEAIKRLAEASPSVPPLSAGGDAVTERGDGREFSDLFRGVLTGDSLHPNLVPLAARMVGAGMHGGAVVNVLRGAMEASQVARDGRWQARYDDLPRTVWTAETKFRQPDRTNVLPAGEVAPAPGLRLTDWVSGRFEGEIPEIQYLVSGAIPLGVPGLVVAQGDTGKSFTMLELAARVAFGSALNDGPVLGGSVVARGTAVVLTSEDDAASVHRRLAALDPRDRRLGAIGDKLIVVPLPSAGGAFPLFRSDRDGMRTTDNFARLRDQLRAIPDLRLVVIDPLQAFALGPINEDPEAGQFVCTESGALASETGATILFAHHMRKSAKPIASLQDARDAVRGTTALVDGVRVAFGLWPVEADEARSICKELRRPFEHNAIARGGIIKANGPARRTIRTYSRNAFGLLEDVTHRIVRTGVDQIEALESLISAIKDAAERGRPFTKTGRSGVFDQRSRLPEELRVLSKHKLEAMVQDALDQARVVQAVASGSHLAKWLDVRDGRFALGFGQFVVGGEAFDDAA